LKTPIHTRFTAVWVFLSGITILSWLLGRTAHDGGSVTANTPVTIGVLAIGCVKARLILQSFMEVRTAPRWLRLVTDTWLVVFWGAVLGIYLY
jgi:hypothetical protein